MPQVTDEELRKEIEKILEKADLSKTSTNKVIQKLEEVFDTDLASKKSTIDKIVLDFVNSQPSSDEEDGEDEDEKDDDEEEEKEKRKPPKRAAKTVRPTKKTRKEVNKRLKKGSSDEDEDDSNESNDSEFEEKTKAKKSKGGKGGGRGKGSGYTRAYKLSPALSDLMGAEEMPRHEVVKRMWALIKEKQLYDPNNKQFAICDEGLYKVIGTKRFRIFGMMKYLKSHFIDE